MGSVIAKWQICGKKNCRCSQGFLHGPYFWYIQYQRKNGQRKGTYHWTYLGKTYSKIETKLNTILEKENVPNTQHNILKKTIKEYLNTKNNTKFQTTMESRSIKTPIFTFSDSSLSTDKRKNQE